MIDETLLASFRGSDSFEFIESLTLLPDRLACVKQLHEVGKHLYWKEKDLPNCVAMLRAAVQAGLTATEADPETKNDLRSAAKAACFDLASFTWPGWDEPGITVTNSDQAVGMDAARANLRLAIELNKGVLPLSRAHWMLAGHYLAARSHGAAIEHFELAADYARRAESAAAELLAKGFSALTQLLADPADTAARSRLDKIKSELAPIDDGPFFISQIDTAVGVFAPFSRT